MRRLNLETERARLDREWSAKLDECIARSGGEARSESDSTPLSRSALPRLSNLTLLYPLLQNEGLHLTDRKSARRWTLGHAMFVTHAFLEDRMGDGQISRDQTTGALSRAVWEEGLQIAKRLSSDPDKTSRLIESAKRRFERSQPPWRRNWDPSLKDPLKGRRLMRIASGRAYLGFAATRAMLGAADAPEDVARRATAGFDWLAYGLQWADDLEDWPDDFRAGRENFLLAHLRAKGVSVNSPRRGVSEKSIRRIQASLTKHNLTVPPIVLTSGIFERAARIQRELGCDPLSLAIEEKVAKMRGRFDEFVERFAGRLLELTGLSSEASTLEISRGSELD